MFYTKADPTDHSSSQWAIYSTSSLLHEPELASLASSYQVLLLYIFYLLEFFWHQFRILKIFLILNTKFFDTALTFCTLGKCPICLTLVSHGQKPATSSTVEEVHRCRLSSEDSTLLADKNKS